MQAATTLIVFLIPCSILAEQNGANGSNDLHCPGLGTFTRGWPFQAFPPPQCPKDGDVTFHLYTKSNQDAPLSISHNGSLPGVYNPQHQTVFIVHGYFSDGNVTWMAGMKNAFLSKGEHNIILVSWARLAAPGRPVLPQNFRQAASNTRVVGAAIFRLANRLKNESAVYLWCVGHSLGAHTCGHGNNSHLWDRISGLDPAGPLFKTSDPEAGLRKTSAAFVDVIHTYAQGFVINDNLLYGLMRPSGHVDFYPNAAKRQPGCPITPNDEPYDKAGQYGPLGSMCSHGRAYVYFTESILSPCCHFNTSCHCSDIQIPESCQCRRRIVSMGYHANNHTEGMFYIETNSQPPFCRPTHASSGVDRTLKPTATGRDVIDASVDKIQQACIFPNDRQFLRRVAMTESSLVNDHSGGIWQVNEANFQATQQPRLQSYHEQICFLYEVDWTSLRWSHLSMPLYSALAARMRTDLLVGSNISWSINDQARLWKDQYTTNPRATGHQNFIDAVAQGEKGCDVPTADNILVVDGSGSVGLHNFEMTKQFLVNLVEAFDVAQDKVRFALIVFDSISRTEFSLHQYKTKTEVQAAIRNVSYPGGGTRTDRALYDLMDMLDNDARPPHEAPRIAIVATDGQSNNQSATIIAARDLHSNRSMTVYSVGITNSIRQSELEIIASQPSCMHVFRLQSFAIISHFRAEIQRRACRTSAKVEVGSSLSGNLTYGQSRYFSVELPCEGVTFQLSGLSGAASLFVSYTIQNPSSALYDLTLQVETGETKLLFVPSDICSQPTKVAHLRSLLAQATQRVFSAVQGMSENDTNSYHLDTAAGEYRDNSTTTVTETTQSMKSTTTTREITSQRGQWEKTPGHVFPTRKPHISGLWWKVLLLLIGVLVLTVVVAVIVFKLFTVNNKVSGLTNNVTVTSPSGEPIVEVKLTEGYSPTKR